MKPNKQGIAMKPRGQQSLCPPYTPREESSPFGLACDWHCEVARPSTRRRESTPPRDILEREPTKTPSVW